MRRPVSGVLSSWLTVPTRFVFASSRSRNFVTSCRMTAAPLNSVSLSPIARMRGQVVAVLAPHPERHHAAVVGRQVVLVRREHGRQRLGEGRGQPAREFREPRKLLGRRVAHLEAAVLGDDEERVRRGRERRLHGALGPHAPAPAVASRYARSRAAIVLNDRARLPSSSRENSGTSVSRFPSPSAVADAVSALIGFRSDAATSQARTTERATAAPIATERTRTAVLASCSARASVSREAA